MPCLETLSIPETNSFHVMLLTLPRWIPFNLSVQAGFNSSDQYFCSVYRSVCLIFNISSAEYDEVSVQF